MNKRFIIEANVANRRAGRGTNTQAASQAHRVHLHIAFVKSDYAPACGGPNPPSVCTTRVTFCRARKRAITKGTLGTLGTPQQRSQCRGVHSENVIEMEKYIATSKGAQHKRRYKQTARKISSNFMVKIFDTMRDFQFAPTSQTCIDWSAPADLICHDVDNSIAPINFGTRKRPSFRFPAGRISRARCMEMRVLRFPMQPTNNSHAVTCT